MSKYNINSLKEKISPRTPQEIQKVASDRFSKANETLGMQNKKEMNLLNETKISSVITRKTFSIPLEEINLIQVIKDKALDNRIVLSESEVIRIGLLLASELSTEKLKNQYENLKRINKGKPSRMK